jgi:cell division protein FtsN
MDKYLLQLLKEVNTIIIPGLGALTLTNAEKGEILFMPYLKFDDGKLATHISEREGMTKQDATNLISKYVREIEATLNRGETYDMYQFGKFLKGSDGQVTFQSWGTSPLKEEPKMDTPITEEPILVKEPEVVSSVAQISENTVSVQKSYEATEAYSEEDQWNDDLDLPPINHTIERPKQPIIEKTKKDKPKRRNGLIVGVMILLLLIGCTLILSLFYNTAERTTHQLAGSKEKQKETSDGTEPKTISSQEEAKPELEPEKPEVEAPEETLSVTSTNNTSAVNDNTSGRTNFHIVMGAFRSQKNAENYVNTLNQQGASAAIITQMEGMYLVSYGSYSTPDERREHIEEARQICPKAWLMIYP